MDVTKADVRREWGRLQRLSQRNRGVVYIGYRTGQVALHSDSLENCIERAFLTAITTPGLGDSPLLFYHAVVHCRTDDESAQRREQFRHPFPALDWLHETVPDFDLLETVCVNGPDESTASATDV